MHSIVAVDLSRLPSVALRVARLGIGSGSAFDAPYADIQDMGDEGLEVDVVEAEQTTVIRQSRGDG